MADYTKYSTYPFPSHDISPSQKGEKWSLEVSEAIHARYMSGKSGITQSDVVSFRMLRRYAEGRQDPDQYRDRYIGKSNGNNSVMPDSARKGWMNVDFNNIFSPAPKFRDVAIGMFENEVFKIYANAIDPISGAEKEKKKWELWFETVYADTTQLVNEQMGVPSQGQRQFAPETLEELEMFDELGGFKLENEIGIEKAFAFTEYISDDEQLKRLTTGNFFDLNVAIYRDYVDPQIMKVKYEYVDPESFVIQASKHYDYHDATWVGVYKPYSIQQLRADGLNISEKDLMSLANDWSGKYGNQVNTYNDNSPNINGTYAYDEVKVKVLDSEYLTSDTIYKEQRKYKSGAIEFYNREDYAETSPPQEKDTKKKKTKKESVLVWRRAKWIVGTKYCWDYGLQFDQPRPKDSNPRSSFHVLQLPGKSKMELMIPNLDSLQLTWLKLQNAKVQAPAAGLALEYKSLSNMKLKGKNMKPLDIIKIGVQTNKWIYQASTHRGQINTSGKPIQELEGGMGRMLQELVTQLEIDLNFIRELTGITYGSDASNPKSNVGLGVTEQLVAATNNAMRKLLTGYIHLKESVAINVVERIKSVLQNQEYYEGYYPIIGVKSAMTFRIAKDKTTTQYGIKLQAMPTESDIIEIRTHLEKMTMAGKNGNPLITAGEYFFILDALKSGSSFKGVQKFLSHMELKAHKRNQETAQQNSQMAAKSAQETEVNKQTQERETYKFKTDEDIRKSQAESQFDIEKAVRIEEEKRKTAVIIKSIEANQEKIVV